MGRRKEEEEEEEFEEWRMEKEEQGQGQSLGAEVLIDSGANRFLQTFLLLLSLLFQIEYQHLPSVL